MKRTFPVRNVSTTDDVRVPSPKKRTPFSKDPSVTPVAAKMSCLPGRQIFGFVDLVLVLDAHAGDALFEFRLVNHQASQACIHSGSEWRRR